MFTSIVFIALAGAMGAQAAAIPSGNDTLLARAGEPWTNPDGNTAVRFADNKISFGNLNPVDAIQTLYDNCYEEGFCNGAGWSMGFSSEVLDYTMNIQAVEGQYASAQRGFLIEALKAAASVEGVIEYSEVNKCTGGGCVGCSKFPVHASSDALQTTPECQPRLAAEPSRLAAFTCASQPHYIFPESVGVSYGYKEDTPDVINLRFSNDIDSAGSDFCGLLLGLGSSVAGAVNGIAGSAFSLGALACQ